MHPRYINTVQHHYIFSRADYRLLHSAHRSLEFHEKLAKLYQVSDSLFIDDLEGVDCVIIDLWLDVLEAEYAHLWLS